MQEEQEIGHFIAIDLLFLFRTVIKSVSRFPVKVQSLLFYPLTPIDKSLTSHQKLHSEALPLPSDPEQHPFRHRLRSADYPISGLPPIIPLSLFPNDLFGSDTASVRSLERNRYPRFIVRRGSNIDGEQ